MSKSSLRTALLIATGILLFGGIFFTGFQTLGFFQRVEKQFGLTPSSIFQLVTDGETMVASTDGRVNILLLGVGGGNHDGSDLTDTIIIVSFHLTDKTVSLISVPRDIWSDALQDKINSAYHYGGLPLSSSIIESIVGIPIHYTAVVDFAQFKTMIDYIGGIDVNVTTAFIDEEYPIAGKENDECNGDWTYACRYQTISFEKGIEHMDGDRALMYVRSRHAENNEGNDFARGKRQQDVVIAVKAKILSLEPWYNPEMSHTLFQALDKATVTNLTVGQLLALGKLSMGISTENIKKISIESYLEEAPTWKYNRYALEPKESFEEIHAFIKAALL